MIYDLIEEYTNSNLNTNQLKHNQKLLIKINILIYLYIH